MIKHKYQAKMKPKIFQRLGSEPQNYTIFFLQDPISIYSNLVLIQAFLPSIRTFFFFSFGDSSIRFIMHQIIHLLLNPIIYPLTSTSDKTRKKTQKSSHINQAYKNEKLCRY